MPRKLRNPTTSVTVVRMIDEAWAGSARVPTPAGSFTGAGSFGLP
jgi:hypothetical protein